MKMSEQYKQNAREVFVTGIVLLSIGLLWLSAVIALTAAKVKMNVEPFVAAIPCLIFFAASMWAFFVEYPSEKYNQQISEEEESKEEKNIREQALSEK